MTPRPLPTRIRAMVLGAIVLAVAGIAAHKGYRWLEARNAHRERLVVWLPYASGDRAFCAQGPMGAYSHGGDHAWDFTLAAGRPVMAAAGGRVIRVIDDRTGTGVNDFNAANQVFVDHGGGLFGTYLHHRAGSARVAAGQVVAAGAQLAEVGATGTTGPHIHFDLRGPSWHQTHALRFRTVAAAPESVAQGGTYASATPAPGAPAPPFSDSRIDGDEFKANGIRLLKPRGQAVPLAFLMFAGQAVTYRGKVDRSVRGVHFFLWRDADPSEYSADATVYDGGKFELVVRIPAASRGPRWYRITTQDASGRLADAATLPVLVR